ncbi:MAG TPA: 4-hydroxythreonine-4-phosphate dehydrogenase PdxA [Burkholderiaceae bacterium]|jgi:4-hydroxythreonine-4-phosphate dehydrogenase|nr:4-hydroxythreonine-4-phosphate dehydrogenase PdxA [Burkholderiaceae bacterium]
MDARIAISMGDAAGIGPEIIAKGFREGALEGGFVVGDLAVMRRAARLAGAAAVAAIDDPRDTAQLPPRCIPVLQPPGLPSDLAGLEVGRVHAACGAAAALCIREAARWVTTARACALVTAPIHKEALAAAGEPFPGHTEMLQSLAGGVPVRMMLANEELRTVLVSIHLSLREAIDAVSFDAVLQTLRIAHSAAQHWGLATPRIAVAGLNPHAGEGGLFGSEEASIIAPAVLAARSDGIDASGPYAPDTVFMRARRGEFDIVIAMYHDQGLIPVKYLGVEQGVNVTLGLPFVRTSPDHGTAFDIAGTGRADPSSLVSAFRMAQRLGTR